MGLKDAYVFSFAIDRSFASASKKKILAEVRAEGIHLIASHVTHAAILDKTFRPQCPYFVHYMSRADYLLYGLDIPSAVQTMPTMDC